MRQCKCEAGEVGVFGRLVVLGYAGPSTKPDLGSTGRRGEAAWQAEGGAAMNPIQSGMKAVTRCHPVARYGIPRVVSGGNL